MLAGCSSSSLLSPRHRLRSEPSAQFQACHFPMSTQRLDLPCSFSRKESSSRPQPVRPVGLSLEKQGKQNIRLPPLAATSVPHLEGKKEAIEDEFAWRGGKGLKRFAEHVFLDDDDDESCVSRAKRKRCRESDHHDGERLSFHQLGGGGSFWFTRGQESSQQVSFSLTCSGEENSGFCFVPSNVNNPNWVDSVASGLTGLGEKDGESSRIPVKEASGSSASSERDSLGVKLPETSHEIGNGSRNPNLHEGAGIFGASEEINRNHGVEKEFELVRLLTGCVEAIGSKNISAINHFIASLGLLASPRGGSTLTRLTAYYTEALALRVTRLWPHIFQIAPPRDIGRIDDIDDAGTALRFLNQVSPIPKFIHFTANEMLLRAFEGRDRVHVIDFDIKQGLQWPSLFQSLASRPNPPSHVRITGIGESKQELLETGDRLHGFAETLNLNFEFHPVVDRLEDVRLWMLHVKEGESVAVNCVFQFHKTLYHPSGTAFRDFLGLVLSTRPSVVVMAEQEAEHNSPRFESRICNSLRYYSAMFDLVHSTLPPDSPIRFRIEEMFGHEIRNIVACEGSHRSERHESFEKWRLMMEQGGLHSAGVSDREVMQSQMILKMYNNYRNYNVRKKQGEDRRASGLTLSWQDQDLYTVSAWTPSDVAGSSSSFSQPS